MPRFKFETGVALKDTLIAMGMPEAFSQGADFSGINGGRDLFVQAVIHKAIIAVDEKGTTAAAATGVVVGTTSLPPQLRADRPFLFFIRHDPDGRDPVPGPAWSDPSKYVGTSARARSVERARTARALVALTAGAAAGTRAGVQVRGRVAAAVGVGRGLVQAVIAPRRPGREADAADQRGRGAERPRQQRRTQAARLQVQHRVQQLGLAANATERARAVVEVNQRSFGDHVVTGTNRDLLDRDARRRSRTPAPPLPRPACRCGTGVGVPSMRDVSGSMRMRAGAPPGSGCPHASTKVSDDAISCTSALRAVRCSTIRSRQWTQGSPVTGERTTSGPASALAWNFTPFCS